MSKRKGGDDDVHAQVSSLKRRHQQEAVLAGEAASSSLFWAKKVEQDIRAGAAGADSQQLERERNAELERVRARRAQNDFDFAQRQEGIGDLERLRLAAEAAKEASKEEQFHLKQSIERARKRLDEARAQPIDELVRALHLQASHAVAGGEWRPQHVLQGMRVEEAQALLEPVQLLKAIDVEPGSHAEYWQALDDLLTRQIDAELAAQQADRSAAHAAAAPAPPRAALAAVDDMVAEALNGSYEELRELEEQVEGELADPQCADPEFWAALRPRIARRKAETTLERVFLEKRGEAACVADVVVEAAPPPAAAAVAAIAGPQLPDGDDSDGGVPEWMEQSDGRFSPPLVSDADVPPGTRVVDAKEDRDALMVLRRQVQQEAEAARVPALAAAAGPSRHGTASAADEAALAHARATMAVGGDEAEFSGLVPIEAQDYWWREKHRPRRPKFFNKVHTGYDWNKYNRAHYDVDNPPPKVVQGYKFNIFYPDLVDKSKAPTYKVLPNPSGDDSTVLLKFMAGAPYEDVAFQIVNKEWDRGGRKGFKNVFDRGILQLYFSFKRTPYRR